MRSHPAAISASKLRLFSLFPRRFDCNHRIKKTTQRGERLLEEDGPIHAGCAPLSGAGRDKENVSLDGERERASYPDAAAAAAAVDVVAVVMVACVV